MSSHCSTCGKALAPGDRICSGCGDEVWWAGRPPARVRRCPRCGYRGEGIAYFRRPKHVLLLLVVGLFTYGLGGLIYWLIRRNHRVCPECGLGWERSSRGLPPGDAKAGEPVAVDEGGMLPSGGVKRRVLGVATILVAAFLLSLAVVQLDPTLLAVGGGVAATGAVTFWWGWRALQARRDALMANLQRRVLILASQRRGTLTVTEVAADLDLSLEAAEKVLISMDDGFRVRSEITNEGLLLYEFPEIQHRRRLSAESGESGESGKSWASGGSGESGRPGKPQEPGKAEKSEDPWDAWDAGDAGEVG